MKNIRLVSWNVNGLRAVLKKDFFQSVKTLNADVLCIQETRLQDQQLTEEMTDIENYASFWACSTEKKGYSGVGSYTRLEPVKVTKGQGIAEYDQEGRVLEMEFEDFILYNVYFPNGQMSDDRLQYKLDFYRDFFKKTEDQRAAGKSLIITGDFNTAHNDIDLKNPKANENTSGFLRIERDWLDRIVKMGYVDTFRHLYPEKVKYSWWSYRFNARKNNAGWRIDYFFVSRDLFEKGWILDAYIENQIFGSDHCPVGLQLRIK